MSKHLVPKVATALLAGASAVALGAAPAGAAARTFTQHQVIPVDGAVVICGSTALVASGSFEQILHITMDNQGLFHLTGTGTPRAVTLDDGAGNVYSLRGATWFGGTFTDPEGNNPIVLTSTDKFSIVSPGGGLFGRVNMTEHLSPNGKEFGFDFGTCESP
jgi:hypothetical protein